MIETMLTQTFRVACDRCGVPAGVGPSNWFDSIETARKFAVEHMQFRIFQWMEQDCPRELTLCPTCHEKAVKNDPLLKLAGRFIG